MECETAAVANFFVVRWKAFTSDACDHVVKQIQEMHQARGQRVVYLGIMPADMARTDEKGRKALDRLMTGIGEHCELAAVAVEARGFAGAAFRSMLAGFMFVSGRSSRFKFVDTVEAGMQALEPLKLPDRAELRAAIAKVGGVWKA